jgi:hypothetical protein
MDLARQTLDVGTFQAQLQPRVLGMPRGVGFMVVAFAALVVAVLVYLLIGSSE